MVGFVLGCLFWTRLGILLLTVVPGLRRTLAGVVAFVVGAFAGSIGVGRLTVGLFTRPSAELSGLFVRLAVALAGASGGGLLLTWLLQRDWSKKT
jgi:hypothetical protein